MRFIILLKCKTIWAYSKVLGMYRQAVIKRKMQLPSIAAPLHGEKSDKSQHMTTIRIKGWECKEALATAADNISCNEGK